MLKKSTKGVAAQRGYGGGVGTRHAVGECGGGMSGRGPTPGHAPPLLRRGALSVTSLREGVALARRQMGLNTLKASGAREKRGSRRPGMHSSTKRHAVSLEFA